MTSVSCGTAWREHQLTLTGLREAFGILFDCQTFRTYYHNMTDDCTHSPIAHVEPFSLGQAIPRLSCNSVERVVKRAIRVLGSHRRRK